MTEVKDALIDAIMKIAADKQARKRLEPQVMQPLQLERWQVSLAIDILALILEALNDNTEIS